jgi:hypothetical protein
MVFSGAAMRKIDALRPTHRYSGHTYAGAEITVSLRK